MSETGYPRLLVLRGGAIGDFIVTLPALTLLRERWPDAYIEVMGYPRVADLAREGGLADRVTSLESAEVARWFSLRPDIPQPQAAYARTFNLVIQYLYDPEGTVKRNMEAVGVRRVIYGTPIVRERHAVDHLLRPLETLAIYPEGVMAPRLRLDPGRLESGRERLRSLASRRVVALHPGSGSPRKNWPFAKFLAAAAELERDGWAPLVLLGDAEEELARQLEREPCPYPVVRESSLLRVAELLSACGAFIGNDAGVTHLAAALGVPVVAVFGPTRPELWAPRGPAVRIVSSPLPPDADWSGVPVAQVLGVLRELLCAHGGFGAGA